MQVLHLAAQVVIGEFVRRDTERPMFHAPLVPVGARPMHVLVSATGSAEGLAPMAVDCCSETPCRKTASAAAFRLPMMGGAPIPSGGFMTGRRRLLQHTATHAGTFLDSLEERRVGADATLAQLREALKRPLPEEGRDDTVVIDELVRDCDAGILGNAGGRFFGWVIGGATPAALAADWLTSAWDQNAALYACAPAVAVIEEVTGGWLKQLLGLPNEASFAFTTGAQMAHVTALAAARTKIMQNHGWDVERQGMTGAPAIRVLTSGQQHASLDRAVRLLGLGTDSIQAVGADDHGRIDLHSLHQHLAQGGASPIVCLQAGEINTGAFDQFAEATRLAHQHGAWVHVDGAFGLWAQVSEQYRHLLAGVADADSWTTDGHKWLNVPFDSGFGFVRHPHAHRDAMSIRAAYLVHAGEQDAEPDAQPQARDQIDWTPEWSRRGRAIPVYAAIRALGRRGIADIIERCSQLACRLATEIGALDGAELLVTPQINQGLVRFLAADGRHDDHTEQVIERIQRGGAAWFGGTTWKNMRAMRISVVNWQTTDHDVTRAVHAVREALYHPGSRASRL